MIAAGGGALTHQIPVTNPNTNGVFHILVVDDEEALRTVLSKCLKTKDREVLTCRDGVEAVDCVEHSQIDLVFLDVNMPGPNGIETLKRIKQLDREVSVVMMSGYGTIENAIEAMKNGADEFLLKPLSPDAAKALASRIELQKGPRRSLKADRSGTRNTGRELITQDPVMRRTTDLIERIAPLPSTVLIEGESGTGKELIAKELHRSSPRSGNRFVAFNCAVIPEQLLESELFGHEQGAFTGASSRKLGYFEAAQGGTIFLDEIGEMSVDLQAKLLRVLQERSFRRVGGVQEISTDVRVIAATNRDLEREAAEGRFRKDLYYRINVVKIEVPPLRERTQDIPLLAQHFVNKYASEFGKEVTGVDLQVLERFLHYRWEGNVRELQNVIERAVAVTNTREIGVVDLPDQFLAEDFPLRSNNEFKPYQAAKSDFELEYLTLAMEQADGNIALASRLAGISRQNLYEKLARHGIEQSRFRHGENGEVA